MDFEWGILIFVIMDLFIIFMAVFVVRMAIKQRKKDDAAPLIVVEATIIEKHKRRKPATKISTSTKRYYATFEFEDGIRHEFIIRSWDDYYAFVVGDIGRLSFQGTRYVKFESEIMSKTANLKGFEAAKDFISKVIEDNLSNYL